MGRAFKLGGDPRPAAAVAQFYFFLFYQFLIVIMSARAIHDNGIESLNRPVLNCSTFCCTQNDCLGEAKAAERRDLLSFTAREPNSVQMGGDRDAFDL